jgi:hypothetical protein
VAKRNYEDDYHEQHHLLIDPLRHMMEVVEDARLQAIMTLISAPLPTPSNFL